MRGIRFSGSTIMRGGELGGVPVCLKFESTIFGIRSDRLRTAGVSFEDRQDLLGHRSGRITTHYSAPDIARLLAAANSICEPQQTTVLRIVRPTVEVLPEKVRQNSSSHVSGKKQEPGAWTLT